MIDESDIALDVGAVATKLGLHPATIRRMFAAGQFEGFRTGPSGTRIRIFKSSLMKHIDNKRAGDNNTSAGD
jgi:hypothetical protein